MKPENLTLFNQIENGVLTKGNTFVIQIFNRNLLKAGKCPLANNEAKKKKNSSGRILVNYHGRRIKPEESQPAAAAPQSRSPAPGTGGHEEGCMVMMPPEGPLCWTLGMCQHVTGLPSDLQANHSRQAYFPSSRTVSQVKDSTSPKRGRDKNIYFS